MPEAVFRDAHGRTLLAGSPLALGGIAVPYQAVLRLELLQVIMRVVDEGETSGLATTKVGAETENGDGGLVGLVELSELGPEVFLGDVGTSGVEDVTTESWKSAPAFSCVALAYIPSFCAHSQSESYFPNHAHRNSDLEPSISTTQRMRSTRTRPSASFRGGRSA